MAAPNDQRTTPEWPTREPAPRGLGLRAQITLALITGLSLSVILVGIAVDRFATHALVREREELALGVAHAVAATVGRIDAPPIVRDLAEERVLGRSHVVGLEFVGNGEDERRGLTAGIHREAPIEGGVVRVWVAHPAGEAARSLVRIVVLYASLGALAILLVCFVLLTQLIVRPIERLRSATERFAAQREPARVEGASEVIALATSWNAMARDLQRERSELERKVAELENTTRSLREAQNSLVRSEKLASVGRLAAGVAHEIGNPLSAILGLVELVRSGDLAPDVQAEFLGRIQSETERIHRVLRELLDFARAPSTEDRPVGSPVALEDIVDHAVRLVAPQKDLRSIDIERRVAAGLPNVRADADRLTQVVLNLLLNAADAIESSGGAGTITVNLDEDGDEVVLTVADTGPGIAEEAKARLFEPFFTTKPVGRGTGLGLAVCHTVIEELGGSLRGDNAPEGGARFEVRLRAIAPGTRAEDGA